MELKNTDYKFVARAALEDSGILYDKDARASYIINEISFHFNQPCSDFSYELSKDKSCVEITVCTDYARVMYILSMLPKSKVQSKSKDIHDNHFLSIYWKDVEKQFYSRGMIYMMTGYCPINDKQYLTLQRKS